MNLKIDTYKLGSRPDLTRPAAGFLEYLGEEGIRKLVHRHYDLLRQSAVSHLFPIDDDEFKEAQVRSADFMVQICGGPDYFNQNRGRPMLINRHLPFAIDAQARVVWLECYRIALLEMKIPADLELSFWNYIQVFSAWMINSKED